MNLKEWRQGREYKTARKRLGRVNSSDVLLWADSGIWAVQAAMEAYQRTADPAALVQAQSGAVGLLAAVDVLVDKKV